ncbi:hypothetical protein QBC36DRAFT_338154 [Triangularia setosa]|uniref:Secreted protein n=1 Tax=Triangularia setosa TaxID=2587417 RepID=A0AAN6VZW7_9PEZI|nr:hypothetical protein QBC36DRAFT_338154 [Podospora setosa]
MKSLILSLMTFCEFLVFVDGLKLPCQEPLHIVYMHGPYVAHVHGPALGTGIPPHSVPFLPDQCTAKFKRRQANEMFISSNVRCQTHLPAIFGLACFGSGMVSSAALCVVGSSSTLFR